MIIRDYKRLLLKGNYIIDSQQFEKAQNRSIYMF
jgi:hypothetical protein